MKNIVHFEPISPETYESYIQVGTEAYNQHYKHLWSEENSAPYIKSSFTLAVLKKEENDENTILYRILSNQKAIGVLKITLNASLDAFTKKEALCVDKIYILNEYSGRGTGKKVLQFAMLRAQEMQKKIVWLDTMKNGPALEFYLKNRFEIYRESEVTLPTILEEEKLMWVMVRKC